MLICSSKFYGTGKTKPKIISIGFFSIMNNIRVLFSGPLFIQFMVFVALIAITLLWFDQNVHAMGIDILFAVNCLLSESLLNYVSCTYGGDLTICFSSMANIAYETHWYRFSSHEKRFIGMILKRAQKEFTLTGCQLVTCSMATFMAVIYFWIEKLKKSEKIMVFKWFQLFKTAFSYYLIAQKFSEN